MRLKDKVAVVTGAAQGIGQAIAIRFAEEGAGVALADLNAAGLEETAELIKDAGGRVVTAVTDVGVKADVLELHKKAEAELGPIHVLVNNAGIFSRAPFLEMSEEAWDQMMAVHLKGTMLCCQSSIRSMVENDIRGSVVNMASISSWVGFPQSAAYCTAKSGIVMLTKVLAHEFGEMGIRVNAMAPGIIDTAMNTWFLSDDEMRVSSIGHIPLGYVGETRNVADLALFLASDESRYVTGTTIPIDGGYLTF